MSRTRHRLIDTLLQILCILLLLALLVGVLLSEAARRAEYWHGDRATLATVTDTCGASAYFFRDETLVESVDNGPVFYLAESGTAVTAGQAIAKVYADGANAGTRERASEICAELARLEAALSNTVPDFYGAYGSLMGALSTGGVPVNGDATDTLLDALDKRDAAANGDAYRARAEVLRAELDGLIKNDAAAFANTSVGHDGIFYREADGYEGVMTPTALESITNPAGLSALIASPQKTEKAVGKVVRGGSCRFAAVMVANEHHLTPGASYRVTLTREGLTVDATLDRMIDADKVLMVFTVQAPPEELLGLRFAEIEIACGSVSGISVPMSAVYEEDGALVTCVVRDGVAKKCVISPLYRKDGCLLVSESTDEAGLHVGDVVVVSARRVHDGKVLK